jgi:lipocalin
MQKLLRILRLRKHLNKKCSSRDYLWILARDKQLTTDVREPLVERARALGIDIEKLIWVDQKRNDY